MTFSQSTFAEPPPAHQRRFLVRGESALTETWLPALCARLQKTYIGAVFLSADEAGTVRVFLDAGCTAQLTTFYSPGRISGLTELSGLLRAVWRRFGRGTDRPPRVPSREVAEILAVGATDTIGVTADVTRTAHATALLANRILGRRELPCPVVDPMAPSVRLPADAASAARRTAPPGAVPPERSRPDPPLREQPRVDRLLREETRVVSLECEQRIELLHEILDMT